MCRLYCIGIFRPGSISHFTFNVATVLTIPVYQPDFREVRFLQIEYTGNERFANLTQRVLLAMPACKCVLSVKF